MAHFALLDENNVVQRVEVVSNNVCQNETEGVNFLKSIYGNDKVFVQTSYNGNFRKNFARVDGNYDSVRDAFIAPKTHQSWILNETTCQWEAPVAKPQDGNSYVWDEPTLSWVVGI